MKLIVPIILVAMVAAAALLWFLLRKPNPPLPRATVTIGEHSWRVEVADTVVSRMRGLSGRELLGKGGGTRDELAEGMLFRFSTQAKHGFWMKGMRFPLDIVWIRDGKIVGIAENVPAPKHVFDIETVYPPETIDTVLELNAGEAEKSRLVRGGAVVVRPD